MCNEDILILYNALVFPSQRRMCEVVPNVAGTVEVTEVVEVEKLAVALVEMEETVEAEGTAEDSEGTVANSSLHLQTRLHS